MGNTRMIFEIVMEIARAIKEKDFYGYLESIERRIMIR